jgi:hypothetical protein
MRTLAEQEISAGTLGLLIVVLLCVATVLLIRNMSKRIKRLPESFSPPDESDEGASGPSADA